MTGYTLPHFGYLPIENLESRYVKYVESNGLKFKLDLNFEASKIEINIFEKIFYFIENLHNFIEMNTKYILNDYHNGDEDGYGVKFYIDFHLEQMNREELSTLINYEDTISEQEQLLTKLKLVRIGLYPECESNFAIFDYSFGREITNYLVVIVTNENGQLEYITVES